MVNFQDGRLLPHPFDLRQKPGGLKQRPCRLLSPTSRPPSSWSGSTNSRLDHDTSHNSSRASNHHACLQTGQPSSRGGKLRGLEAPGLSLLSPDPLLGRVHFPLCACCPRVAPHPSCCGLEISLLLPVDLQICPAFYFLKWQRKQTQAGPLSCVICGDPLGFF